MGVETKLGEKRDNDKKETDDIGKNLNGKR